MTDNQSSNAEVKFIAGEKVNVTLTKTRGRSVQMTAHDATVVGESATHPECYWVRIRRRGDVEVHQSRIRKAGQTNAFTEWARSRNNAN